MLWVLGGMGSTAPHAVRFRGVYGVFLGWDAGRSWRHLLDRLAVPRLDIKKIIPLAYSTTGTG